MVMNGFAWVTQINGKDVYRSIKDPKIEVDEKGKKLKKKIKNTIKDVRVTNPKKNKRVK
jgi:hypothetical protein